MELQKVNFITSLLPIMRSARGNV